MSRRSLKQTLVDRCATASRCMLAYRSQAPRPGAAATQAAPKQHAATLPPLALPRTAAAGAPDAALCCTLRCGPSVFAPRTYGYRPVFSFKLVAPISYAAVAEHAAGHSSVVSTQSLLANFGRHVLAYQAAHAARRGFQPHEVCWFLQLPDRVAEGAAARPLSFSVQMGSPPCAASFMLSMSVATLHAAMLAAKKRVLETAAQGLGARAVQQIVCACCVLCDRSCACGRSCSRK
jgi:hypothetical protein